MFESNVNAPSGVSYAPPLINFNTLGDLLNSFSEGVKQKQAMNIATAFKDGLPKDASGNTDYGKIGDVYLQNGQPQAGVGLSQFGLTRQNQALATGLINGAFGGPAPTATSPVGAPQPTPAFDMDRYLATTKQQESSGNPNATNPNSTATGYYGLTTPTRLAVAGKYGLNPADDESIVRALTKQNQASLTAANLPVTDQNTYLAHFLGEQGAVQFLRALETNPNAPAIASVAPRSVNANRSLFFDKGGQPISARDFYNTLTGRFGTQAAPQTVGQGQPQMGAQQPMPDQVQRLLSFGAYLAANGNPTAGQMFVQIGMELLKENKPQAMKRQTATGAEEIVFANPATQRVTGSNGQPVGSGMGSGGDESFQRIAQLKANGATREQLFAQVPLEIRDATKALIEGRSLPTNLSARSPARNAAIMFAHAIDDNFDETMIPLRVTFAKSMGSQQVSSFGGQVRSAGTIVKHLGSGAHAFDILEKSGALNETLPVLNRMQLAAKGQMGDKKFNDALGKWDTAVEGIAGELTQLLTGGVGAESSKQEWRDRLNIKTQPISKIKATLDEAAQLMMGRLAQIALAKERAYGQPTDPLSLLGPHEQQIMETLRKGTYRGNEEPSGTPGPTFQGNPVIRDKAAYDKLPPGAMYVDARDGQTKQKGSQ